MAKTIVKLKQVEDIPLSKITQSGASTGMIPSWDGSAWTATTPIYNNVSANRLLGRVNTSGIVQEISLGVGLSFSGTTLNSTGGTVTSVGMTVPSILSVTPTTITGSGIFAVTLVSQTAKTFFAAPNAANGTPLFRTIVPSDLGTGTPSLSTFLAGDGTWQLTSSITSPYVLKAGDTMSGSLAMVNSGLISRANYISGQTMRIVRNPEGGYFASAGSNSTGAIVIKHAVNGYAFVNMTIRMMDWNTSSDPILIKVWWSYSDSTGLFTNNKPVLIEGNNRFADLVRVGLDASGNVCCIIGDVTTVYNGGYIRVDIKDVSMTFNGTTSAAWETGWSITQEIDLTGYTLLTTLTPKKIIDSVYANLNYIRAQNAADQTANYRISGSGQLGSLGVGGSPSTSSSIIVSKNILGAASSFGVRQDGEVQNTVSNGYGFYNLATVAPAHALGDYNHYAASQNVLPGDSTMSRQLGFRAASNMISAGLNYGFYGEIPAGTGRWNVYMVGTAQNYFAANVGIGSTSLTTTNLRISKTITGGISGYGIFNDGQIQSDVTTLGAYYYSNASTQATTFTLSELSHFYATQGTFGAGSTITTQSGFKANSTLVGATNNYGFHGMISVGTGRWNLYMQGTAANYLAGGLGIGVNTFAGTNLKISKSITGGTTAYATLSDGAIQSDVTVQATIYQSTPSVASAAFTITDLTHFSASQGTIGASAAVTNQSGFRVQSTLTGATNNYGFYGLLAAATGRWNLYMSGSAQNYLSGSLGIGINIPTEKLHVVGNALINGYISTIGGTASGVGLSMHFDATNGAMIQSYSTKNIYINPIGNGVGIGIAHGTTLGAKLDIGGTLRVATTTNATGNFLTINTTTGLVGMRTAAETLTDIGVVDTNFANTNLTATSDRVHTFAGNQLNISGTGWVIGGQPGALSLSSTGGLGLVIQASSTNSFLAQIQSNLLNANRIYQLPNVAGTFVISVNGVTSNSAGDITIADTNFVNTNLTSTGNRTHTFGANTLQISATDWSITGAGTFSAITSTGVGTAGIGLKGSATSIYPGFFKTDNLTNSRTYQLPDASGTFIITINGNAPTTAGNIVVADTNFAANDLTFTSFRTHNMATYDLTFNNGNAVTYNLTSNFNVYSGAQVNLQGGSFNIQSSGGGNIYAATGISMSSNNANFNINGNGQVYINAGGGQNIDMFGTALTFTGPTGFTATINDTGLTAIHTYTLPNETGTFALQSWVIDQGYITTDTNFANTDLTAISDRVHNFGSNQLSLNGTGWSIACNTGILGFTSTTSLGIGFKSSTTATGTMLLKTDNLTATRTLQIQNISGTIGLLNDDITSAAFSGTTTKTLTLTKVGGGTITASFTDSTGSGTVTSVDLTSSDITVGGTSPITTSGTFTLTLPTINANVGTFNNLTVNAKGQVTAASNVAYLTANQTITLTGDVTGSGTTAITTTIASGVVTYAKFQNLAGPGLIGRGAVGAGVSSLVTIGTGLSLSTGGVLSGNTGTVTSVGMTVFSGLSVSPASITTSGTFAITTTLNGVIKGNGSGFSASAVNLASEVTGTLPVSNGGTGTTTLTGVLFGNGTSAFTALASSTATQLLRRNPANNGYEWWTPDYITTANVILNQNVSPQTADFNITGTGTAEILAASNNIKTNLIYPYSGTSVTFSNEVILSTIASSMLKVDVTGKIIGATVNVDYVSYVGETILSLDTTQTIDVNDAFPYSSTTACIVYCDASSGSIILTLPGLIDFSGKGPILFIKTDSTGNTVTIKGVGTVLINNSNTQVLTAQYQKMTVRSGSGGQYWLF